jgi:hypothetical protein
MYFLQATLLAWFLALRAKSHAKNDSFLQRHHH